MKYVVTGGAGYIGSHTCKLLKEMGHEVIIYDNFSTSNKPNKQIKRILCDKLVKIDLRNKRKLKTALLKDQPDIVIHFAAKAYVGESVSEPLKYYENNVSATTSLLLAMKYAKVNNIIFSSSCATYGVHDNQITEDTLQTPVNPYGKSKLYCENIILDYSKASDLKYVFLRYFNVAGSDPDCVIGENHDPETHLIPNVIKAALSNSTINVFGNTYNTADGSCVRDYIHVCDLARAHYIASQKLFELCQSNYYNLGTGSGNSVFEIINKVEKITKTSINSQILPPREGDPASLVANSDKAQSELNWKPIYNISDMINHAYQYLKMQHKQ